ncbi:hypothetical protein RhiirB3_436540 [Rhizophagus irregularis]|nr:hypothetical protein RhiirB3_436540 [Rhizophagus irregularis]
MERAIHRFIPLIRFYYISSKDFVTKVYPFREIMPKDLISNILIFRMAPDEKINVDIHVQPPRQLTNNIDSIIINQNHVAIFANWIDRKLCKFKLLYRASRDGNTNTAFHEKCDNKGATIVIVKIKNSEQIVGGYNPLNWDSSGEYKLTYDSFLFSFTDRNNFHSAKVGYSYGDVRPIGCHGSHGPIFGYSDRGKDFNFYGKTWFSDVNHCYPNVDIPKNFKADDYEVFQVAIEVIVMFVFGDGADVHTVVIEVIVMLCLVMVLMFTHNSYVVFGDGADVHTVSKRTKEGNLKKSKPVEDQCPVVAEETIPKTNILIQQNINQINLMFPRGYTCWHSDVNRACPNVDIPSNSYFVFGDGADVHTVLKADERRDLKIKTCRSVVAEVTIPQTNIVTPQNINHHVIPEKELYSCGEILAGIAM